MTTEESPFIESGSMKISLVGKDMEEFLFYYEI